MFHGLMRWMVAFSACAFVLPAWGCFAAPDAKATHEISLIELPPQRPGVVVVFESEGYALRAPAEDVLSELSQPVLSVVSPNDLANALRSKMALGRDIHARELADELISTADGKNAKDARREQLLITRQANEKTRFAFAKLLQEGKTSVMEISTHRELSQMKLDRFNEICHGGRLFMTTEEKEILRVVDWIS